FVQKKPVSRQGLIEYIRRYSDLGMGTATKIVDAFGEKAIEMLRTDAHAVHDSLIDQHGRCFYDVTGLQAAGQKLQAIQRTEETRVQLCDLLLKAGFSAVMIDT